MWAAGLRLHLVQSGPAGSQAAWQWNRCCWREGIGPDGPKTKRPVRQHASQQQQSSRQGAGGLTVTIVRRIVIHGVLQHVQHLH